MDEHVEHAGSKGERPSTLRAAHARYSANDRHRRDGAIGLPGWAATELRLRGNQGGHHHWLAQ